MPPQDKGNAQTAPVEKSAAAQNENVATTKMLAETQAPQTVAEFYKQQAKDLGDNLHAAAIKKVGENAPGANPKKEVPVNVVGIAERILRGEKVSNQELAIERSYSDFNEKKYYPPDGKPVSHTLRARTDFEESQLMHTGRRLKESMSLILGPNSKDPKTSERAHDKATKIVADLIPKISWDKNFPEPVLKSDGTKDEDATRSAQWTWVQKQLTTLETVRDNNANLVDNPGTGQFQGLRAALQADIHAQDKPPAILPPGWPHVERDKYLKSKEPRQTPIINQSKQDSDAAELHDQQQLDRIAADSQGNNNPAALNRALMKALGEADNGKAKQIIAEVPAPYASGAAEVIKGNEIDRTALRKKVDILGDMLGTTPLEQSAPGQQVDIALDRYVSPTLLSTLEKGAQRTPTEIVWSEFLKNHIKTAHTNKNIENESPETVKEWLMNQINQVTYAAQRSAIIRRQYNLAPGQTFDEIALGKLMATIQ